MTRPAFVETEVDLSQRTTLALPGKAAWFAAITSTTQLEALVGGPDRRFVLGGGSNLVLTGDFDGLLLHLKIPGRALIDEDADAWYVRAGAGESWHEFVMWTLAQGWPGLENLALIPGSVGAAPIQNIGAYGLEVGERIEAVNAIDMNTGERRLFRQSDCRFGYRDSLFKQHGWHLDGRWVITDVTFRLPKQWQALTRYADLNTELGTVGQPAARALDVANAVIAIRRRKLPDPAQLPNAGSFFQNPVVDAACADRLHATHPDMPRYAQADGRVKLAAGWLIENAGWKGRRLGAVGMYQNQALVLVNHGHARGSDVVALMQAVQADVLSTFGVPLVPEPIFL